MLSGRHIHRPKNIIRSSVRCFHTINICLPARIVNFRENHCSSCLRINLIFQVIRFVRSQFDCTQCICFSRRFYLRTEFFIYDSRFCRIYPMQSIYLFIGIVHILHLVYKPSIAQRMRIPYWDGLSTLQRKNKVTGIQHIQHRKSGRSHLLHITSRLRNSLEHAIHLGTDMLLYHFLIAAQFGGMISTDALMPIRSRIFIKRIAG